MAFGPTALIETLYVKIMGDSMDLNRVLSATESSVVGWVNRVQMALVGIGTVSVREFAKFENVISRAISRFDSAYFGFGTEVLFGKIQFDTNLPLVRKEMEETVKRISMQSQSIPIQLAQAYTPLLKSGFGSNAAMGLLPAIEKFAVVNELKAADATKMLIQVMHALKMQTGDTVKDMENLVKITDILTKGSQLTQISAENLANALANKAGTAARAYGFDLETTTAFLMSLMEVSKVQGGQAGQIMEQFFRNIQRAAIMREEIWKGFNVKLFDPVTHNLNPIADILRDIEKHIGSLSDEGKAAAMIMLGLGQKTGGTAIQVMGLSEAMREYEEGLRSSGGYTERVWVRLMDTVWGQFMRLRNTVYVLAITIGDVLSPAVRYLLDKIQYAVAWFIKLDPVILRNILGFLAFMTAISLVRFSLMLVALVLRSFYANLIALATGFGLFPFIMRSMIGPLLILISNFTTWIMSFSLMYNAVYAMRTFILYSNFMKLAMLLVGAAGWTAIGMLWMLRLTLDLLGTAIIAISLSVVRMAFIWNGAISVVFAVGRAFRWFGLLFTAMSPLTRIVLILSASMIALTAVIGLFTGDMTNTTAAVILFVLALSYLFIGHTRIVAAVYAVGGALRWLAASSGLFALGRWLFPLLAIGTALLLFTGNAHAAGGAAVDLGEGFRGFAALLMGYGAVLAIPWIVKGVIALAAGFRLLFANMAFTWAIRGLTLLSVAVLAFLTVPLPLLLTGLAGLAVAMSGFAAIALWPILKAFYTLRLAGFVEMIVAIYKAIVAWQYLKLAVVSAFGVFAGILVIIGLVRQLDIPLKNIIIALGLIAIGWLLIVYRMQIVAGLKALSWIGALRAVVALFASISAPTWIFVLWSAINGLLLVFAPLLGVILSTAGAIVGLGFALVVLCRWLFVSVFTMTALSYTVNYLLVGVFALMVGLVRLLEFMLFMGTSSRALWFWMQFTGVMAMNRAAITTWGGSLALMAFAFRHFGFFTADMFERLWRRGIYQLGQGIIWLVSISWSGLIFALASVARWVGILSVVGLLSFAGKAAAATGAVTIAASGIGIFAAALGALAVVAVMVNLIPWARMWAGMAVGIAAAWRWLSLFFAGMSPLTAGAIILSTIMAALMGIMWLFTGSSESATAVIALLTVGVLGLAYAFRAELLTGLMWVAKAFAIATYYGIAFLVTVLISIANLLVGGSFMSAWRIFSSHIGGVASSFKTLMGLSFAPLISELVRLTAWLWRFLTGSFVWRITQAYKWLAALSYLKIGLVAGGIGGFVILAAAIATIFMSVNKLTAAFIILGVVIAIIAYRHLPALLSSAGFHLFLNAMASALVSIYVFVTSIKWATVGTAILGGVLRGVTLGINGLIGALYGARSFGNLMKVISSLTGLSAFTGYGAFIRFYGALIAVVFPLIVIAGLIGAIIYLIFNWGESWNTLKRKASGALENIKGFLYHLYDNIKIIFRQLLNDWRYLVFSIIAVLFAIKYPFIALFAGAFALIALSGEKEFIAMFEKIDVNWVKLLSAMLVAWIIWTNLLVASLIGAVIVIGYAIGVALSTVFYGIYRLWILLWDLVGSQLVKFKNNFEYIMLYLGVLLAELVPRFMKGLAFGFDASTFAGVLDAVDAKMKGMGFKWENLWPKDWKAGLGAAWDEIKDYFWKGLKFPLGMFAGMFPKLKLDLPEGADPLEKFKDMWKNIKRILGFGDDDTGHNIPGAQKPIDFKEMSLRRFLLDYGDNPRIPDKVLKVHDKEAKKVLDNIDKKLPINVPFIGIQK